MKLRKILNYVKMKKELNESIGSTIHLTLSNKIPFLSGYLKVDFFEGALYSCTNRHVIIKKHDTNCIYDYYTFVLKEIYDYKIIK